MKPITLLPVAGVLHSLFGWDVHVRWERLVHKSPKAHAEVAGGAVHSLGQTFAQRPQAEEVVVHGVGEIHEVVEIHGVVFYLSHLHREALSIIWDEKKGCRINFFNRFAWCYCFFIHTVLVLHLDFNKEQEAVLTELQITNAGKTKQISLDFRETTNSVGRPYLAWGWCVVSGAWSEWNLAWPPLPCCWGAGLRSPEVCWLETRELTEHSPLPTGYPSDYSGKYWQPFGQSP